MSFWKISVYFLVRFHCSRHDAHDPGRRRLRIDPGVSGDQISLCALRRLIDQTQRAFPHYTNQVEILPLEKGGSERRYYRVRFTGLIRALVKVQSGEPENERFLWRLQIL